MIPNSRHTSLKLLWWLRSLTIAGYIAGILLVTGMFQVPMRNASTLWEIIAGLIVVNIITSWRIGTARHIGEREFFGQLMIDLFALFGMLYYTGGATNPFASLFILQVIIAAVSLPALYTWITTLISIALYSVLIFWNVELVYLMRQFSADYFSVHLEWRWISFVALALVVAWFVERMASVIRRQNQLLEEAKRVAAVGSLAASAAHELGTPLAIMSVLTGELGRDAAPHAQRQYDTLKAQITHCKDIVSQIAASAGMLRAEAGKSVVLTEFINGILSRFREQQPSVQVESRLDASLNGIRIVADYSLEQAFMNLLKNAADASAKHITLEGHCWRGTLFLKIEDNGVGIPLEMKDQLGQPGVSDKPEGMGLGLYLARTVFLRLGGSLTLSGCKEGGAVVQITLPLKEIRL